MGTITANFSYREFEVSATASRNGICNVIIDTKVRDNVKELTETILQPLRTAWGSGLNITSGYRCPKLNALVGGSKTSVHQIGLAADIVPSNGKIDEFIKFAEKWLNENGIMFDQSLNEKDRKGAHWWHIGLRNNAGQQRRQFMTLTKKDIKTV